MISELINKIQNSKEVLYIVWMLIGTYVFYYIATCVRKYKNNKDEFKNTIIISLIIVVLIAALIFALYKPILFFTILVTIIFILSIINMIIEIADKK